MLQSKRFAARDYHPKSQPPPSQTSSNRSFSSYLISSSSSSSSQDHAVVLPNNHGALVMGAEPTQLTTTTARPALSHRPLSDLNHSFTTYDDWRYHQHQHVKVPRPFVQESYQAIIRANCRVDDPSVTQHPPTSSSSPPPPQQCSPTAVSYRLHEAPTPSTESADSRSSTGSGHSSGGDDNLHHHDQDVSFGDRSSFWNEWAEELIHTEEVEYAKIRESLSPGVTRPDAEEDFTTTITSSASSFVEPPAAVDESIVHDDPTITFVVEEEEEDSETTPDQSLVDGPAAAVPNLQLLPLRSQEIRRTTNATALTHHNNNNMVVVVNYPPALMVKASRDDDDDDDDVEILDHRVTTTKTATSTTDRDVVAPPDEVSPDQEDTPKISGSRVVTVESLATTCPLPPDDDDDASVSPMKSVLTFDRSHVQDDDDDEPFIIHNTSISTLAAMNISQATVQLPTLTVFQQAMEYSTMATDFVQSQQYPQAMEYFQRAIDCYTIMNQPPTKPSDENTVSGEPPRISVLSAVNIAGCYRNMGTVSRLLGRYDEVTTYLGRAEEYYTMGRETVEIRRCESLVVTLDGPHNNTTCSYYTSAEDETMCLDGMILETMQSRAHYYTKYQDDKKQAVECHEQCLTHLLHIYKMSGWNVKKSDEKDDPNETEDDEPVREQGVTFVPLSKEHHTSLLIKSLEALGNLYRSLVATSSTKACMILFEDAIDILQCRLEQEESTNDELVKSVSLILRYLSEIYFERQEMDKAVDALHDSTAIKLTASGEPCSEALEVMDKMGVAHEQMENYDKALSCYEQTLFARCRFYGNTHFYVAKSLVNVARVTELRDGSTTESVELYKAANAIFALHMLSDSPALDKDVENILQLIPTVIRQGRYEKAISDLNLCLAMADDDTNSDIKIDKAQIYFDLGRAYMGMQDYKLATTALTTAMKETGDVKEEEIFSLLQRVEFLQREEQNRIAKSKASGYDPSNLSLSYVPDPTLSFHDITFQLQGDRSMYTLDDVKAANPVPENAVEKVAKKYNDPLSEMLYRSFVKENEEVETNVPTIASIPPSTVVQDKTPLHKRIRVKLARKVAKLIALLRAKCQNSKHLRNLKELSQQCLQACKSRLRMGPPQPSSSNRNAAAKEQKSRSALNGEEVVMTSFEEPPPSKLKLAVSLMVKKCSGIVANSSNRHSQSLPFSFVHHQVVVTEEEDGGFGCQLIHSPRS